MKIQNLTRNTVIASHTIIANGFFSRMIGLLNRKQINRDEALVITRCNSIHMFFMRFPIDVIFIDKNNKVVAIEKNIQPFALSKIYWKAASAIELAPGVSDQSQTQVGDQIL